MMIKQPSIENFGAEIHLLQLIQRKFPTAIIAGGCVRDLFCGKPKKDIDIFVELPEDISEHNLTPTFWEDLLELNSPSETETLDDNNIATLNATSISPLGQAVGRIMRSIGYPTSVKSHDQVHKAQVYRKYGNYDSPEDNGGNTTAVFGGSFRGVNFDVVVVNTTPVEHVEEYFDLGLCKTYFDGNCWTCTHDFITDFQNRTVTILGKHMSYDAITHCVTGHAHRVLMKYPDFKLDMSPHIQSIMKKHGDKRV